MIDYRIDICCVTKGGRIEHLWGRTETWNFSPSVVMLPFVVTIPATVPQRSEIPEGIMNYPVLFAQVRSWVFSQSPDNIRVEPGYDQMNSALFTEVTMCRFVHRSLGFGGTWCIQLDGLGSHHSIFVRNSGNHAHEFMNQKSTSRPSPPWYFSLIRFIQFTLKILFL
jgi:hypothetical protein